MPDHAKIIFAGSGAFGVPTLRARLDAGHEIAQVFSQPDRPAGRGKKLTPTPIAELATQLSLPLIRTDNINNEILPAVDLMIVIAFGQKIGQSAVNHARLGSVNLHSSLLPKYRGAAPINRAILSGDSVTGNSIIRLAEKMDAGAILARSRLTIGEDETAGELHDRLASDGAPLMLKVLDELQAGTAVETQQDHTLVTLATKLSRQTAIIDWSQSAKSIARQINGLSPWPGCRVALMEGTGEIAKLTLVRSVAVENRAKNNPGEVETDGTIAGGDGKCVEILEIQPEGKRPMKLADFRNGKPWRQGMQLVAIG
jgi:methionyl-tRNA formyltransferase